MRTVAPCLHRSVARSASILSLMAALGCSSPPVASPVGGIGLALRLSGGELINQVDFRITGNGIIPVQGQIGVQNGQATVSAFVGGIPPSPDYRIEMTATSTDGGTTCTGAATFDVVRNQTTAVSVAVQCRMPPTTGGVIVGGTINSCPVLTAVVVSPISVALGQLIDLGADAFDADARDTLTYRWTSTGGVIGSASTAYTTFQCSSPGAQTLTITVSDGACTDSISVGVTCVPPRCGNGVIETGEQCDPPVGNTCDTSCQRLTICGNGVVERTEECDPPNGTTCASTCRRTVADAGSDGVAGQGDAGSLGGGGAGGDGGGGSAGAGGEGM